MKCNDTCQALTIGPGTPYSWKVMWSSPPALLRHSWYITLFKCKVCNVPIWYAYALQNDYPNSLANTFIMPHSYHFFFVVIGFKINCLSNFQAYSTELLTIITKLYSGSPELILTAGNLHTLTCSSLFSLPLSLWGNHHSSLCFSEFGVFRFHIQAILCSICLSVSDLLDLAWCPQGPSMLWQMAG